MNCAIISRYLGNLLLLEAAFLVPPAAISASLGEEAARRGILLTVGILVVLGLLLRRAGQRSGSTFYAKEGFVLVALAWVVMSFLGSLPFYFSGEIPSLVDCFFETVSGFTTTGASILTDVEAMSKGLLFWRSFTHWLGGMGMLVFLLAVAPGQKGQGFTLHLMRAESPGPSVGKLVPKMRQTAKILYLLYVGLTIICVLFLLAGGMPLFDSLCTAFGTAGTGGFGIKNDSMAGYSIYLQGVCTVFMALFGVNFSVYYLLFRNWRAALKDEEVRLYFAIMLSVSAVIACNIYPQMGSVGMSIHEATFHTSSIMTTTGFAISNFDLWPELSRVLLLVLMIAGACAGSTGGGVKTIRLLLIFKNMKAGFRKLLHPNSVETVKLNGRPVSRSVLEGINAYMSAYCLIAIASLLVVSLDNFSLVTNLSAVLSCFNNIGPGLDIVGPIHNYSTYSDLSKIVLSLDMLLGRLEIFPMLILLRPATYRRRQA